MKKKGLFVTINERITNIDSESISKYFREITHIKPFKDKTEENECAKLAKLGDEKAFNELITRNLRFVISIAKQYKYKDIPLEDLINEGNYGLIEAAKKFDPNSGNKFITYAIYYIRRAILNFIISSENKIKISHSIYLLLMEYNKKEIELSNEFGRSVYPEEVKERMKSISDGCLDIVNKYKTIFKVKSLNEKIDDDNVDLINMIEDNTSKPIDYDIINEDIKNKVLYFINKLDDESRYIIKAYFGIDCEKLNETQIAFRLNKNRNYVTIKLKQSLKKLRKLMLSENYYYCDFK